MAWGLAAVMGLVLAASPIVAVVTFLQGAEHRIIAVLPPREWGLKRGTIKRSHSSDPRVIEGIIIGFVGLARVSRGPHPLASPPPSTRSGTGR